MCAAYGRRCSQCEHLYCDARASRVQCCRYGQRRNRPDRPNTPRFASTLRLFRYPTGISGHYDGRGHSTLYNTTSFTGPTSFGSGGAPISATSDTGPLVGLGVNPSLFLSVPQGYLSGNLSDSATYDGATFTSLGVTPGTYTWTWGSGDSASSFTIDAVATTPLPATLPLFAGGLGALGLLGWRRKRKAQAITV